MEKKRKKDIGSAKERRKKFDDWIDVDYLYKCQGKIRPIYNPKKSGSNGKRKQIICSICKEHVSNATNKADHSWYCTGCEKYFGSKNLERRKLGLPQTKSKKDFNYLYESKLNIKILYKKIIKFLKKRFK